jgi:hypothetical protein
LRGSNNSNVYLKTKGDFKKMSVLDKLTEGIVDRDLHKEGAALLSKWEATGLLEGLDNDKKKSSMARLLENQAKQLLKEASSMAAGGDVEGFAAVAFPIVRRVFGGLIANDLVSVQPMSLPSGLIFFLDFQHTAGKLGSETDGSLYGGGKVGQQITGGVVLDDFSTVSSILPGEEGFYNLNNGYSSPTGSVNIVTVTVASASAAQGGGHTWTGTAAYADLADRLIRWDPDLSGSALVATTVAISGLSQLNKHNLTAITDTGSIGQLGTLAQLNGVHIRRLTQLDPTQTAGEETNLLMIYAATGTVSAVTLSESLTTPGMTGTSGQFAGVGGHRGYAFPIFDNFGGDAAAPAADSVGVVAGTNTWGLENTTEIPEIDIKVDSVSVTAMTKKLKAKWTPELGQDLNAYHNLDAEVELTSILSEQIALEIDREILLTLLMVQRPVLTTGHVRRVCSSDVILVKRLVLLRLLRTLPERLVSGMRLLLRPSMMYQHRFIVRRFAVEPTSLLYPPRLRISLNSLLASELV